MKIGVHCTVCGFHQGVNLRDLPEEKLVCPLCEHEAELPDEQDVADMERAEARRRSLTALGAGAFALGLVLALGYAAFSGTHLGDPLMGTGLLAGAGVLGLLGLIMVIVQESKATRNDF